MPTYVYKCNDCEHVFEVRQRMRDEPLTDCPRCEVGGVRRVINSVGVVFKGSGFYVTDARNRKNGSSPNGTSANTGTKASEKSDSTTAETKKEKKETKTGEASK